MTKIQVGDRVVFEKKWTGLHSSSVRSDVIAAIREDKSEYRKLKGVVIAANDNELAVTVGDKHYIVSRRDCRRLRPKAKGETVWVTKNEAYPNGNQWRLVFTDKEEALDHATGSNPHYHVYEARIVRRVKP